MKREYGDYVEDIVNSVNKVMKFTKDMRYSDFMKDEKTVFAVVRALEIIGEAAKNIPESLRRKYPDIPWKDMSGMRDRLIHEYFGVKLDVVWDTVRSELPELEPKFQKILRDLEKED
jgi:uncharacterized protein with HEPN domain